VVKCGAQVAEALSAAHKQGIVHRDLKPGNVTLTRTGAKLLDFGLARTAAPAVVEGASSLTEAKPLTREGTILGTFQYMAPEQLEGVEADARTDIFALGALLYEMATGRRAFEGTSKTSLIAAIVSSQPAPISAVAPMAPPALDHIVRKCLEKDPDDRWQSAHDVASELRWLSTAGSQAGVASGVVARRRGRERVAWIAFALASLTAAGFGYGYFRRAPAPLRAVRAALLLPPKVSPDMLAVSPDGSRLVFSGYDSRGQSLLWLRPLDGAAAQPLAGTENGLFPFWSPDSRAIAFFADQKLKRVDAGGGSAIVVSDGVDGVGGSWGRAGVILVGQAGGPLLQVPASGGSPKPVTRLDASLHETSHRYPFFLPDGRHFLYLALNLAGAPDDKANQVCAGALDSPDVRRLLPGVSSPVYASGRLLLARDRNLVAQRFDPGRLEVGGEPETLAEQVGISGGYFKHGQFSASGSGALVYADGAPVPRRLQWLDRSGRQVGVVGEPALQGDPRISRDGGRATVQIFEPNINAPELWIVDLARGARTRLTSGPSQNSNAVWSPDGSRIAFSSDRSHQADLYEKAADGSLAERALLEGEGQRTAADWSPDGRFLLYWDRETGGQRRVGLSALPLSGERKPLTILERTTRQEFVARLSPDGRWLAYATDDTGRAEVFVTSFPAPAEKWQVSTDGGTMPRWRRDGRELFYVSLDGRLMSVDVPAGPTIRSGVPRLLFETLSPAMTATDFYDVSSDGQRFLMTLPADQATRPLSVIVNWTAGLDRP
jgi:Tol biopolymer transport system component